MEIIQLVVIVVFLGLVTILWTDERKRSRRKFTHMITAAYVLGVLYFTLLSRQPSEDSKMNLVLFYSVIRSLRYPVNTGEIIHHLLAGRFDQVFTTYKPLKAALLNIMLFVPLGYILPLYIKKRRGMFPKIIMISAMCSLCIELTQAVTRFGWFDVDDLFCNITGGAAGYLLYIIAGSLIRSRRKNNE